MADGYYAYLVGLQTTGLIGVDPKPRTAAPAQEIPPPAAAPPAEARKGEPFAAPEPPAA